MSGRPQPWEWCQRAVLAGAIGGGMLAGLVGCESTPAQPDEPVLTQPTTLPTYAQIASAQNARVADLQRVWGATTAIVTYQDQDGQVRTEQAEGYLQIVQPGRVALSLGKQITSEVYFYLGANQERYWWLDRLDAARSIGYVGTHEMATPERAAKFGAPVHPLDLLDLLGITELPEAETPRRTLIEGGPDQTIPEGARVAWSPDGGSVVVDVPGRFGTRRMWFDPASLKPRRVEMLDDRGRVAVYSTLTRDTLVTVRGDSRRRPFMAAEVEVMIPGTPTSVRLRLDRLENREIRNAPFDLDGLLRAYPVQRVENLDEWEPAEREEEDETEALERRVPDRRMRGTQRGG